MRARFWGNWARKIVGLLLALGTVLIAQAEASAEDVASIKASTFSSPEDSVPPSLKPWIPWVLSELGEQVCAPVQGTPTCVWPGNLSLDLKSAGGDFTQEVRVGARSTHSLPGQKGAWPEGVKVDGREFPVMELSGMPVVELEAGTHKITGSFSWTRVPETLNVGAATAFLFLSLDGKDVPLIKREGGNIWLKGLSVESDLAQGPEQVEISVFRQVRDGIPLQIETRLVFQVSGKARELALNNPLVPGTVPLKVEGDLAVALESSGALRVQLIPGRHEISLLARAAGMPEQLPGQKRAAPWPLQEIWTWRPSTELRAVEVTGPAGIDASRTELPADWRSDSAYAVGPADVLKLATTRRAQEQVPSNRLNLSREFWLDEAAQAFTVRDTLSGQMHQGWRVGLLDGILGEAKVLSESQVITRGANVPAKDTDARGVEVRDAELSLVAVSRVKKEGELSAVGWSSDVDSLSAVIHLPPGWDLLAATGVDETSDTWLSRWNLFSVFYVLVLTLAMARLVSAPAGAVAAGALILTHGEWDGPEYIWTVLVVLAALLGLIENGRFKKILWVGFYGTMLVLVLMLVSFSVSQVRAALYPHLDADLSGGTDLDAVMATAGEAAPAAPEPPAPSQVMEEAQKDGEAKMGGMMPDEAQEPMPEKRMDQEGGGGLKGPSSSFGRRMEKPASGNYGSSSLLGRDYSSQKQYQPDAIVQTGPGIPEMAGRTWTLSWSGPVVQDHKMRLYLLSPWGMRGLTILRLTLLFLFAWFLWKKVHPGQGSPTGARRKAAPKSAAPKSAAIAVASVLGLVLLACTLVSPARADEPSDARLSELRARLSRAPSCAPDCVSVSSMRVQVGDGLVVNATVHAGALSAYKLPGPASAFASASVQVDKKAATAVRLGEDGAYYLRLEKGVHEVTLKAALRSDRVTLDVGAPPEQVTVDAEGWSVTGVSDQGRVEGGTLTFQREIRAGEPDESQKSPQNPQEEARSQVAVPPYFLVARSISLGVTGQITTAIFRQSDATSPEVFRLPLLPGERVTTPSIEVKDGVAVLSFPREATFVELTSTLTLPPEGGPLSLSLKAPALGTSSESWTLQCGVVWHCSAEGVVATSHVQAGHSVWTFHPWPGETLAINAVQPTPAEGSSLTIQKATLTLTPGIRMGRGQLEMAVQTSRSAVHTLSIPENARLEGVSVDGTPQAVKSEGGKVRVSLAPGLRRVVVTWQDPHGLTAVFRSSKVNTGAAGVNFRTVLELPSERWLLLAGGPAQGPAILLWGYLVLILGAALLLPRLPYAPLTTLQWILLGLGLTQVPSAVAVLVAGWFFAVGARSHFPPMGRMRHNFLQFLLIGYTLVFLGTLTVAVYEGLVSSPDMEVQGAGSYNTHLVWYSDRSQGLFAPVWSLSVSIWIWRAFMLAWALWLSRSLLGWLKWAWVELSKGQFWVPKPPKLPPQVAGGAVEPDPEPEPGSGTGPASL